LRQKSSRPSVQCVEDEWWENLEAVILYSVSSQGGIRNFASKFTCVYFAKFYSEIPRNFTKLLVRNFTKCFFTKFREIPRNSAKFRKITVRNFTKYFIQNFAKYFSEFRKISRNFWYEILISHKISYFAK
jgi:hypothetical protein